MGRTSRRASTSPPRRPLVGVYRNMSEAREAMVSLEQAGLNGGRLTIAGEQAESAVARRPAAADSRFLGYIASSIRRGALAGAAVGAGIGLAFGIFLSLRSGDQFWEPELWAPAVAGLFPGAIIGALLGFRLNVAMSPAWSRTFAEVRPGAACVALEVSSDDEEASAAAVLRETHPQEVLVGAGDGEVRRVC